MISADYVAMMARYNAWQNRSLYREAAAIGDEERTRDRGAFFGSIEKTLAHILWADELWLSRIADWPAPSGGIAESAAFASWPRLVERRPEVDRYMIDWASAVDAAALSKTLSWHSAAVGRDIAKPVWALITHLFNHQTHHRGQVHAMLTAAGARPDDTDIPFMPDEFPDAP